MSTLKKQRIFFGVILLMTQVFLQAKEPDSSSDHPRWNPVLTSIGSINLLPNASFECGADGWSSVGKRVGHGGDFSGLFGEVQSDYAWDGRHSLQIELGADKTPVMYYDSYPMAKVVQNSPLAANIGWIQAEQGKTYTLSAYIRADRPNVQAKLVFRYGGDQRKWPVVFKKEKKIVLTQKWKRYTFSAPAREPDLYISLGPDISQDPKASTIVWIDAVQLEQGDIATPYAPRETIEIGLDTEKFGNVFNVGEPIRVKVYGASFSNNSTTVRIDAQLEDYFGRLLPANSIEMEILSLKNIQNYLTLENVGPGYYRAKVSWIIGNVKHVRKFDMAIIKPYPYQDSPFGINHAPTTPELCEQLRRAGLLWARTWALDWSELEPTEGQLSFERSDPHIDRILEANMPVLALLPRFASTEWASEAPQNLVEIAPKDIRRLEKWIRSAYAPKQPKKLYDFMEQAARHYRNKISFFEFFNEPIGTRHALPTAKKKLPGANYTTKDYVNLLKGAYRTLKSVDPNCRVIGGMQLNPLFEFKEFVSAGGLDYVDIYSIHPYPLFIQNKNPERYIEELEQFQEILNASSEGGKPVWVTECGYYGEDEKPWTPWVAPPNHFPAKFQLPSEKVASDYSIRYAVIMLAHGVEKIFYHHGVEEELNNGSGNLGSPLLGSLGTPAKFYAAQSALANMLGPIPQFVTSINKPDIINDLQPTDNVYGYVFQCGKQAVLIAWTGNQLKENGQKKNITKESKQVLDKTIDCIQWSLKIPYSVKAYNIVGTLISEKEPILNESPIYLASTILTAHELAKQAKFSCSADK